MYDEQTVFTAVPPGEDMARRIGIARNRRSMVILCRLVHDGDGNRVTDDDGRFLCLPLDQGGAIPFWVKSWRGRWFRGAVLSPWRGPDVEYPELDKGKGLTA